MSISNPLTAGSDIQRATSSKVINQNTADTKSQSRFGEFANDIVNISRLGLEQQQKETAIEASRDIEKIANEVVRVSSSIGQARSSGNLNQQQATKLYNKIASLL